MFPVPCTSPSCNSQFRSMLRAGFVHGASATCRRGPRPRAQESLLSFLSYVSFAMSAPHGLAIIGAGPAALAILLRVSRVARDECASPATRDRAMRLLHSTVVIDASGGWLALWRRKLGSQGVSHLRSPTFVLFLVDCARAFFSVSAVTG